MGFSLGFRFKCNLSAKKPLKFKGQNIEIIIEELIENREFICPKECQYLCDFKRKVGSVFLSEKLTCTTLLLQVKNVSAGIVLLPKDPPWIVLVDSLGNFYRAQEACSPCKVFALNKYGATTTTNEFLELLEGQSIKFLLFFPRVPFRGSVSNIYVSTFIFTNHSRTTLKAGDFFFIKIIKGQTFQKEEAPEVQYEEQRYSKYIFTPPREELNIFAFTEKEIIMEGYCEECSNYDRLLYVNGLYLCETCRECLRASHAPEFDLLWTAISEGIDAVKSLLDLSLTPIKLTSRRQPVV